MKKILQNSFWQLLFIYAFIILLISLEYLYKFSLHFEIFAVVLAVIWWHSFRIKKEKIIIPSFLLIAVLIVLFSRSFPYLNNNIPLGYDPGMYRSTIEAYANTNIKQWMNEWSPPGLFLITTLFSKLVSVDIILVPGFIIMQLILLISIYVVAKEFYNKNVASVAALLFSISTVQFNAFELMYYKNILGLILMLFGFYYIRKQKIIPAILFGAFLFGTHRPTFLIYGLSLLIYTIINVIDLKNRKINFEQHKEKFVIGISVIILGSLFYINSYQYLLVGIVKDAFTTGIGGGHFINFLDYQFSTLSYLFLGLMGVLLAVKRKEYNLPFIAVILIILIVYFRIAFYNRFILHLDLLFILFSATSVVQLLNIDKKKALAIISILLIVTCINFARNILDTKPLISDYELDAITALKLTPDHSIIMATSSIYSPWLEGYSGREVIAPGLFNLDKWNKEQWIEFWEEDDQFTAANMLSIYPRPLFIHVGVQQKINRDKFKGPCFTEYYKIENNYIYQVNC